MSEPEDDPQIWPPAPHGSVSGSFQTPETPSRTSYLAAIIVMWIVTLFQILASVLGMRSFGGACGIVGFVLSVYLVTRHDRAARINGGWRLAITVFCFVCYLIVSRQEAPFP